MERLQPTLKDRILLRIPAYFSHWEERFSVDEQCGLGVKDIYKNGIHIRRAFTSKLWCPPQERRFVKPEYTPPFAVGRCVDISDGDYKRVLIDHEGQADYVIKIFGFANIYRGEGAQQKAERMATRIAAIYEVIDRTSGFRILPNRMFAAPYSEAYPDEFAVFEVQQRGLFADRWAYFDPKRAKRIDRQIAEGYKRYHAITVPELLRRGLVTPDFFDPKEIADHMTLYVAWDIVSNRLVARDVVDAIYDK